MDRNEQAAADTAKVPVASEETAGRKAAVKPKKKRTLIDPALVGARKVDEAAREAIGRIRDEVDRGPVQVVVQPNRLQDLLNRQSQMPTVLEEEYDFKTQYPLAFPPEVQALVDNQEYYCLWVKNPYGDHVTQTDMDQARQVIRAMGGSGIYEILTKTEFDGILPPHLFSAEGVIEKQGMLLCYTPYSLWERKRQAERGRADMKLESSLQGQDEGGQIPRVRPYGGEASLPVEIPKQPGLKADVWED